MSIFKRVLLALWSAKFFLMGVMIIAFVMAFGLHRCNKRLSLPLFDDVFVEEISHKFHSYATQVTGKQSLQVAKLQQMEVYERTSKAKTWGISLPDVVVSAEFPVEYNFNVSLIAPWKFERRENELIVHVPEISSQTPAVNVSQIKFKIEKGSILRNEADAKEKLQKELHTFVVDNSILLKDKVRDEARNSIRDFIQNWLSQNTGQSFSQNIRVVFPNEKTDTAP